MQNQLRERAFLLQMLSVIQSLDLWNKLKIWSTPKIIINSFLTVQELVLQWHSEGKDRIKLHSVYRAIHGRYLKQHVNIQVDQTGNRTIHNRGVHGHLVFPFSFWRATQCISSFECILKYCQLLKTSFSTKSLSGMTSNLASYTGVVCL